jgi:NAD dependent epimerase/dehydratase
MKITNKKVLVTGADGFIGSHLAETLVKKGVSVRVLAQYNSFNTWGWLEDSRLVRDMEVWTGDIRDPFLVRKMMKGIDVVFNLAALIAIPHSYTAPASYVDTNVSGALNVCQAALDCGVSKVIQTSTSEVYGTAQYVPMDEKHPLQAQSPYSASKIGADAIAMSYYNAFKLPVVIARPFNTYGPRQSARAVIPTIISQIAAETKVIKLGNSMPTRDFNYVLDICSAFLAVAVSDKTTGETINIGSNSEISIGDLAVKIKKLMGSKIKIITDRQRIRPAGSEVDRLRCDNSKVKKLVGYRPEYSLNEGLKETIKWFSGKENLSKYKAELYNV